MREKTISVTIRLYDDGAVHFDFYEGETGDFSVRCTTVQDAHLLRRELGDELLGWLELMTEEE